MIRSLLLAALLLAGCEFEERFLPPFTPAPTLTPAPVVALEETDVMRGICFEAAFDAADQVFVLRSADQQTQFYDLADHSRLCRQPIERVPFDFSSGRILAGLWSKGTGCTARHEIGLITRDDAARQVTLDVRFVTEGDCPYELVRPFWLALDDVADYAVHIQIMS